MKKNSLFHINRQWLSRHVLIFFIFNLIFSFGAHPHLTYAQDLSGANLNSSANNAPPANVLLQPKISRTLDYLNQIKAITNFDIEKNYLIELNLEKDRLNKVRDHLVYALDRSFRFQDISTIDGPLVVSNVAPIEISQLTIADLMSRLKKESEFGELLATQKLIFNQILSSIDSIDLSSKIDFLDLKMQLESDLIDSLISIGNPSSYPLISELQLENQLTQLWLIYFNNVQMARGQIRDYLEKDFTLIELKSLKERDSLFILSEIYPTEADQSTLLDDRFQRLFMAYQDRDIDSDTLNLKNFIDQSGDVFSLLNQSLVSASDNQFETLERLQKVSEALNLNRLKPFNDLSDSLYKWLKVKNSFGQNNFLDAPYQLLDFFKFLIRFSNHSEYEKNELFIQEIFPLIQGVEESLRLSLSDLNKEPVLPDEPIADEVLESEGDVEAEGVMPLDLPIETDETTTDLEVDSPILEEVILQDTIEIEPIELPTNLSENSEVKSETEADKIVVELPKESINDSEVLVEPVISPIDVVVEPIEPTLVEKDNLNLLNELEKPTDLLESNLNTEPTDTPINEIKKDEEANADSNEGVATDLLVDEQPSIDLESSNSEAEISSNDNELVLDETDPKLNDNEEVDPFDQPLDKPVELIDSTEVVDTPVTSSNRDDVVSSGASTDEVVDENTDEAIEIPVVDEVVPTDEESISPTDEPVIDIAIDLNQTEDSLVVEEDPLSEIEASDVIDFFEGDEQALEKGEFIRGLIESHKAFVFVQMALDYTKKAEQLARLTNRAHRQPVLTNEDFDSFYADSNLTIDQWDEWLSFMNQLVLKFDQNGASDNVITQGVLRFDNETCEFPLFSYDFSNASALSFKKINHFLSNPFDFNSHLIDFCISHSTDITTKNLIGYPRFTKQIVNEYQLSQQGIWLNFKNNATRDLNFQINLYENKLQEGTFSMKWIDPLLNSELANENLASDLASDEEGITLVETDNPFSMSVLQDPDFLFNSIDGAVNQLNRQAVVYESKDRRQNIVNHFVSDPHVVTPRSLSTYYLYNYGEGQESQIIKYDGLQLVKKAKGWQGYLSDNQGLGQLAFYMDELVALDKNNQPIENVNYDLNQAGDELSIQVDIDKSLYPIVIRSKTTFMSPGHPAFNNVAYPYASADIKEVAKNDYLVADFNGDSKNDFAISAYENSGDNGQVDIYYSFISNQPNLVLADKDSDYFGHLIKSADLNQDGFDDLILANPYYDQNRGRVLIYYGSANGVTNTPDLIIRGSDLGDEFGADFALADFNQDQKIDLVVGAPQDLNGKGSVHLFMYPFVTSDSNAIKANESAIQIQPQFPETLRFGEVIKTADLDGDQKEDLLISSLIAGDSMKGHVYAFYQNENPWTIQDSPCSENCVAENADLIFEGEGLFGHTILVRDYDGDQKNDVAIFSQAVDLKVQNSESKIYFFYQNETPWTRQDLACEGICFSANADHVISLPSDQWVQDAVAMPIGQRAPTVISTYSFADHIGRVYHFDSTEGLASIDNRQLYLAGLDFGQWGSSLKVGQFNADEFLDLMIGSTDYRQLANQAYFFYGKKDSSILPIDPPADDLTDEEIAEELDPEEVEVVDEEVNPDEEPVVDPSEEILMPDGSNSTNELNPDLTENPTDENQPIENLDQTKPDSPLINCEGLTSGVFTNQSTVTCSWTDTTGPSVGTFKYCLDELNNCVPIEISEDRSVTLNLNGQHHLYLRVQNSDEGGLSEISSFDFAYDQRLNLTKGPSDGASSSLNPTNENSVVIFSATAVDLDLDSYYMLVCRTDGQPVFDSNGKPQCAGGVQNQYCLSNASLSGQKATCAFPVINELALSSIWYTFVCTDYAENPFCSPAYQGEGSEGSPFFTDRPVSHGDLKVTNLNEGLINPGDQLKFTMPLNGFSNIQPDSFLQMHICSASSTDFNIQNQICVGGQLICSSEKKTFNNGDYSCAEAQSEDSLVPLGSSPGIKPLKVFVSYGNELLEGQSSVFYEIEKTQAQVVSYDHQGDISILPGGSVDISFSALIENKNGWADLKSVQGRFFDPAQAKTDCQSSQNNCYIDPACEFNLLSPVQLQASCQVKVYYNANASSTWKVHMTPILKDESITYLESSKENRVIPPLIAINQEEIGIPYLSTSPDSVSEAVEIVLSNLGNQSNLNVLIDGTDLVGETFVIPRSAQKWDLSPNFDYDKEGYSLIETAIKNTNAKQGCAPLALPIHKNVDQPETKSVYWKIKIPKNQKADLYQGLVYFEPENSICQ